MAKSELLGKRVRCSKCRGVFYDLGKKATVCPKCKINELIPTGTVAEVCMKIQRGGHDDIQNGWTGGIATKSDNGAVFLKCRLEVVRGKFRGREFSSLIGLYSPKGPWWGNEGRRTLRLILDSAYGLPETDYSPRAVECRRVEGLGAFDGIHFIAEIARKKGSDGVVRNELETPIAPGDPRYREPSGTPIDGEPKSSETVSGAAGPTPMWLQRV